MSSWEGLKFELLQEAKNILNYWTELQDRENGGFYCYVDSHIGYDKEKSVLLHCRILWAFSYAYRVLQIPLYRDMAEHAYLFLNRFAFDKEHAGVYWMLDAKGNVADASKHIYNHAFTLYAYSEYYAATNDEKALQQSIALFELIESKASDKLFSGYYESFDQTWTINENILLGNSKYGNKPAPKTMNTHLHILEAYTSLSRVWEYPKLHKKIESLLNLFCDSIISKNGNLGMYFTNDWKLILQRSFIDDSIIELISFGHDIEGSWLLDEALSNLPESVNIDIKSKTLALVENTFMQGRSTDGAVWNECHSQDGVDDTRIWWVQAEAMVGFFNAYQKTGDEKWKNAVFQSWRVIKDQFIDEIYGEWFREVDCCGQPNFTMEKVSPWKCPYHNTRSCLEIYQRLCSEKFDV